MECCSAINSEWSPEEALSGSALILLRLVFVYAFNFTAYFQDMGWGAMLSAEATQGHVQACSKYFVKCSRCFKFISNSCWLRGMSGGKTW